ncbi:class I SAM-dependent methyltransferase, partial [Patescibacteria group bacterium AH-259-L07]|nr:class I SAM-dependent methyltransferase [Patescibacteria group bacterium AH-259-L07]
KNNIITGNYFDKYNSKNPVVVWMTRRFLHTLFGFLDQIKPEKIIDIGCGEGEIEKRLKQRYANVYIKGLDIADVRTFKDFDFAIGNAITVKENKEYDVLLMLEVLEHVKEYTKAFANIKKIKANNIIISVPYEPWFRLCNLLRFAYIKRLGSTPGHVNHFTKKDFKKIIQENFSAGDIKIKRCLIWNFAFIQNIQFSQKQDQ